MAIIIPDEFVIPVDYYSGFAIREFNGRYYLAAADKTSGDIWRPRGMLKQIGWDHGQPEFAVKPSIVSFAIGDDIEKAIGNMALSHNILSKMEK